MSWIESLEESKTTRATSPRTTSLKAKSAKHVELKYSPYPIEESKRTGCEKFQCVIKYAEHYKDQSHQRVNELTRSGNSEINKILQITIQNVHYFEANAQQIGVYVESKFPKLFQYRSNPEFPETCRYITYSLMKELNKFIKDIETCMTVGNDLYHHWETLEFTPVLNRHIASYLCEIPRKDATAASPPPLAHDDLSIMEAGAGFLNIDGMDTPDNGSIKWLDDHPRERALYQLIRATILPMTTLQAEIKQIEELSIPFDITRQTETKLSSHVDTSTSKNDPDECYLYSGQTQYLFGSVEDFINFLNRRKTVNNFITSWSIDARVACHFADIQDITPILMYLPEVVKNKYSERTKYKLLFAYKCDSSVQIPFVSPTNSWEAEVCMSASKYTFKSIDYESYDGDCIILLITVTREPYYFILPEVSSFILTESVGDTDFDNALRFGNELRGVLRIDGNDLNASIISKLVTTKMYKEKKVVKTRDSAPEDAICLKRYVTDPDCDHDVEYVMAIQRRDTPEVLRTPEEICTLKRCDAIQRKQAWVGGLGGRRNKSITSTRKYNKKTKHLHKQPNSHKKHKYTKKSHKKHKYTKRTYKKTHRHKTHRHYKNIRK
jgi:hypothetical protein